MLLSELKSSTGTYVGGRISTKSADILNKFAKDNKVPNPLDKDSYHITIIYSRKELDDFVPDKNVEYELTPYKLTVFKTTEDTNALVIKVKNDELTARHKFIRKEHGATHDFDSYMPHITLSYDIGEFDYSKIDLEKLKNLCIDKEYVEPLDLKWAKNNS